MTVSVNGVTIPAPMRERGFPIFKRYGAKADNGLGETLTAGLSSLTWTFPRLLLADYLWWTDTILNGAASLECPAVLWDDQRNEVSYSSVIVRYPEPPEKFANGYYHNVVIVIDTMVAA